ncbi:General stress protein 26 [Pseudooceanicola antarcticus]|uniref:General stress protein n=1 Tax=Pseudooceanicola antarcticus TaxID=1247613 RepID=A0A285IUH6_9RHOB|nr:pyridoxamine 5'-phosphate oxidase family protein [Pseudooceanicola antarcticus]PJE31861.1 general stress protein [Pseudooceanicola antarcticus]SNY50591.1 General stress protein 26 [Pseudooceanicola antarcticus]
MKDHDTKTAQRLFDRLGDVTAGMLMTGPDTHIPMSHYADADEGVLWFISAEGTAAHQAAVEKRDSHFLVADQGAKLYADISGQLQAVTDPAKLDDLWSRVAGAWFEEGREDSSVRLLRFVPAKAEVWLTEGGAKFLYEIARANVTGHTPDVGEHEVITF